MGLFLWRWGAMELPKAERPYQSTGDEKLSWNRGLSRGISYILEKPIEFGNLTNFGN